MTVEEIADNAAANIVAAQLSDAGKQALEWLTPYSLICQYRQGANEIVDLGLAEHLSHGFMGITPLGLAVRNHLNNPRDVRG